jgi:hypothetical protein
MKEYAQDESFELKTRLRHLITRDLLTLETSMEKCGHNASPGLLYAYNKQNIVNSMSEKRQMIILKNRKWIDKHISIGRDNLANGVDVINADICPVIEECKTQKDFDLFRLYRYYWSSPYSDYVGRRIRILVRDYSIPNKPVIGIGAIGSSIIHIPERDSWIGWSKDIRTNNIIYTMDAYIIGAMPPYNLLLGGKLISYLLASNEIRNIFKQKYITQVTATAKRTVSDLACIFTTSLFGKSSQYNKLYFRDDQLYIPIGETKGYGTFHLSQETFNAMIELLASQNVIINNRIEDGPCWRMRVIKTAAELIDYNPKTILNHSFKRYIYAVPLAKNFKRFLNGEDPELCYYDYPENELIAYWKERWYKKRMQYLISSGRISELITFRNLDFDIQ